MKTADFIKKYCVGAYCPSFYHRDGCREYDGEECDEAFKHPRWRGLKMADRVTMLCEKRHKKRRREVKGHKTYTTAAKLIADLLGDPDIEREVKEKLARRKKINALVAERAKANLTVREVAKRMRVTARQVRFIEESWEDSDLISCPMMRKAYVNAIRTKKKGDAK